MHTWIWPIKLQSKFLSVSVWWDLVNVKMQIVTLPAERKWGAWPVRQPIRNEDAIPNAQLRLAPAYEQQRRQTEKVKAQTYPFPKTQPILDRVQLNHQKLSKETDLQGKEDEKYQRCSLSWFCRLSAKNSLPVFIFVSTNTWNEKRERE